MPIILDQNLYDLVKKQADKIYDKSSAYKSGWIVKTYKESGGKYKDDGKPKNLGRWFKEKWTDIGGKEYPVYRPTKRINIKTPLTADEIDPKQAVKQIALKQIIKGKSNLPQFKGSGLSSANSLTNIEIQNALQNDKKFAGVFMKDELPSFLENNHWYVINMESAYDENGVENDGSHWVCFKYSNPMIYFDPLIGGYPPLEVLEYAKKNGIVSNMIEIQNTKSTACGFFCIACIISDKGSIDPITHIKRFTSLFSKNNEINDKILYQLLRDYGVVM
jgi:hypothetical protein